MIFEPQNHVTSSISQGHSLYQVWTLCSHSFFELCWGQTDRWQTDEQTDSKMLSTPTDIVGAGNYGELCTTISSVKAATKIVLLWQSVGTNEPYRFATTLDIGQLYRRRGDIAVRNGCIGGRNSHRRCHQSVTDLSINCARSLSYSDAWFERWWQRWTSTQRLGHDTEQRCAGSRNIPFRCKSAIPVIIPPNGPRL